MVAARKPRQRQDQPHAVPSPAQVRRHQRQIRAGWSPQVADRRLAGTSVTGDSTLDAMLSFLQLLVSK